jgi:hypothetical protein
MERPRHLLAPAALVLVAAAYALPVPESPLGDEATYLLAAQSLWHDGDLRFERADLARGYAAWATGPRGVALVPVETEAAGAAAGGYALAYGRPLLYPVLTAPVYGLLGPRGLRVLNAALFVAMLWVAWRRCVLAPDRPREPRADGGLGGRWRSGLLAAAFFLLSGAAAWVPRFQPEVLLMACGFFAVALWCRVRSAPLWGRRELLPVAGAGVLLAAAAVSEPLLALLALPVAADLLWSRRLKAAAVFAAALVVAGALLGWSQERVTGSWGPELRAEARVFTGPFPLEARPAVERPRDEPLVAALPGQVDEQGREPPPEADRPLDVEAQEPSAGRSLRRAGWRLFWLGAGRHVGLLPYFPFALFVVGLYLADLRGPGGRSRHLVAAAVLAYLLVAGLGFAGGFADAAVPGAAGAAAAGSRAVALVYPVLLFLPRTLRGGRALLLPFAAAGLWTAPALAVAASGIASDYLLEIPARGPAYRTLPLELELLAEGRLPGYLVFDRFPEAQGGLWLVPRETFFATERHPDGVWVRGASRSEVYVVAAGPVDAVRFAAKSLSAESEMTVTGAAERLLARFDTEGKRGGVPVAVRPELVAKGLGWFLREQPEDERIYRFVLDVTGGAVPARIDPGSGDTRYLGVFLELEPSESL